MDARRLRLLGAAAAALFVLLLLDVLFHGLAARMDERLGPALLAPTGPAHAAALALDLLGGTIAVTLVVGGTCALLWARGERIAALRLAAIWLVTYAVEESIKLAVHRVRPPYALVDEVTYAFPSGHATLAAILAVLLAYRLRGRRYAALGTALAALYALAMAASRVALGVHYPSDVAGGLLLGAGLACFGLALPFPEKIRRRLQR